MLTIINYNIMMNLFYIVICNYYTTCTHYKPYYYYYNSQIMSVPGRHNMSLMGQTLKCILFVSFVLNLCNNSVKFMSRAVYATIANFIA